MELSFQWGRGEEKQKVHTCLKKQQKVASAIKTNKARKGQLAGGGRVVMSAGWSGEPCREGEL